MHFVAIREGKEVQRLPFAPLFFFFFAKYCRLNEAPRIKRLKVYWRQKPLMMTMTMMSKKRQHKITAFPPTKSMVSEI